MAIWNLCRGTDSPELKTSGNGGAFLRFLGLAKNQFPHVVHLADGPSRLQGQASPPLRATGSPWGLKTTASEGRGRGFPVAVMWEGGAKERRKSEQEGPEDKAATHYCGLTAPGDEKSRCALQPRSPRVDTTCL